MQRKKMRKKICFENCARNFSGLEEQTGIVSGTGGTPALKIQIRDGHGIIGDPITQAAVGQPLTLDIVLENTGMCSDFLISELKFPCLIYFSNYNFSGR